MLGAENNFDPCQVGKVGLVKILALMVLACPFLVEAGKRKSWLGSMSLAYPFLLEAGKDTCLSCMRRGGGW